MNEKKFSIIVPVYNIETVISRCIESILKQTLDGFELILINDGSLDRSGKICDAYQKKDSRVKVIHQKNSGVSNARNSGLKIASGKYIIFIDGDDYIEKEYLERICNSECDLVITGRTVRDADGEILEYNKSSGNNVVNANTIEDLFNKNILNCCYAKRFTRDIIVKNNIRFNEDLKVIEDTVFVVEYIQHCKNVKMIDNCDYQYVRYGENTLSSSPINVELIENIEKANAFIEDRLYQILGDITKKVMIKRMSELYKGIIFQMINDSNRYSYSTIKKMFEKEYFRNMLNTSDSVFEDESEKFRRLMKAKSPLLFWLFLISRK